MVSKSIRIECSLIQKGQNLPKACEYVLAVHLNQLIRKFETTFIAISDH